MNREISGREEEEEGGREGHRERERERDREGKSGKGWVRKKVRGEGREIGIESTGQKARPQQVTSRWFQEV